MSDVDGGHAFISYVHEDADRVDRLEKLLEAAGIPVWRDTADLWPGQDWRGEIRGAITKGALVFIACFSAASESRPSSGQNEELVLALEQLRLRRPDQPWLIPVRFDDVDIPELEIGAGRTLSSLQRVDLTGPNWEAGAARLVAGVLRILEGNVGSRRPTLRPSALDARLKEILRDPNGDIALNEELVPVANEARSAQTDEAVFPATSGVLNGGEAEASLYVASLVDRYMELMDEPLDATVILASWARDEHLPTLKRFAERLMPPDAGGPGMTVLTSLRWFPVLPFAYSTALAAVNNDNFGALKALVLDARVRDFQDGRIPVLARCGMWRPFHQFPLAAQVVAQRPAGSAATLDLAEDLRSGRKGKRYTPISDFLHDVLRSRFSDGIPDDDEFADLFDQAEILLGLLALDLAAQSTKPLTYIDPPNYGRFTWRGRYEQPASFPEARLRQQLDDQGESWQPLQAGLFGGSVERAREALQQFTAEATEARSRRW